VKPLYCTRGEAGKEACARLFGRWELASRISEEIGDLVGAAMSQGETCFAESLAVKRKIGDQQGIRNTEAMLAMLTLCESSARAEDKESS